MKKRGDGTATIPRKREHRGTQCTWEESRPARDAGWCHPDWGHMAGRAVYRRGRRKVRTFSSDGFQFLRDMQKI